MMAKNYSFFKYSLDLFKITALLNTEQAWLLRLEICSGGKTSDSPLSIFFSSSYHLPECCLFNLLKFSFLSLLSGIFCVNSFLNL